MIVEKGKFAHEDERGLIVDIVQSEQFEHATVITSVAGSVRGHHYHKESIQKVFILSGKMLALTRRPGEEREEIEVNAGDLITHEVNERHAFVALEDTTFLVLTRGPRGGTDYESDTYREEV